ncbi:hypothetical protein VTN96DRAFT_2415 [Rasamsonia emersonii]
MDQEPARNRGNRSRPWDSAEGTRHSSGSRSTLALSGQVLTATWHAPCEPLNRTATTLAGQSVGHGSPVILGDTHAASRCVERS